MQADRLSQSPFHTIAIDRPTENPPNGEPDATPLALPPQQIKHCHVRGEVTTALFVNPLEVGVPEQAHAARKSSPLAGGRQIETVVRSETAHNSRSRLRLRNCRQFRKRKSATHGSRASPTPACVPWRAGARSPLGRSWSSSGYEIRASSSGDVG